MNPYRHPDWLALARAVAASPADDAPRLVAADWLQDNGDEGRACLIRVQLELERYTRLKEDWNDRRKRNPHMLPFGGNCECTRLLEGQRPCPYCVLRKAEDCLLHRREHDWLAMSVDPLVPEELKANEYTDPRAIAHRQAFAACLKEFRRGFVEAVELTGSGWLEYGERFREWLPVRTVRLMSWIDFHFDGPGVVLHDGRHPQVGRTLYRCRNARRGAAEPLYPSDALQAEWPGIDFRYVCDDARMQELARQVVALQATGTPMPADVVQSLLGLPLADEANTLSTSTTP